MRSLRSFGALALGAMLIVGACGSSSASPSGAAPSGSAKASASGSGTSSPSTSGGATSSTAPASASASGGTSTSTPASSGPIANVPNDQLVFPGKLVICSDLPYAPQEFFDDQHNPTGSDIEIGQEIGRRLGLQVDVVNTVFASIIPALIGGKC